MTRTGCRAVKPGRASGGSRGGTPDQGAVPPMDAVPSPREPQNQHVNKGNGKQREAEGRAASGRRARFLGRHEARPGRPDARAPSQPRTSECGLVWKCDQSE